MAVKSDLKEPDLSTLVLFIYALVFIGIVLYGLYRIPFGGPITREEFMIALPVVISWIAVVFLMRVVLELVKCYHRKTQLNRFVQSRNFLLLAIGGCGFFGCVPRIVVFFDQGWFMWFSIYVSLGGICFSYSAYETIIQDICKINRSWFDRRSWAHFIAQAVIWTVLTAYLDKTPNFDRDYTTTVFLCHLGFSYVCAVAAIDFCYVWRGEIRLNLNPNERQQAEARKLNLPPIPEDDPQSGEFESTFKCKVCNKNYNQVNRIPRMLQECGHTVCEKCADDLLEKNKEHFLYCPYCDTVTLVNGPAEYLPKNYVIVDTMTPKDLKKPVKLV